MNLFSFVSRSLLVVGATFWLAGCGDSQSPGGGGHASEGGHAHSAKYGGKLIELGEHEGSLEFVLDGPGGKLTAYILDAHAENFVRLPLDSFVVVAQAAGVEHTLTFKPVANPATGEKPGDTSQFEATADWLKTTPSFTAILKELPVKSKTYRDVKTTLPK